MRPESGNAAAGFPRPSIAEWLALARPAIAPSLVDDEAWERLLPVAGRLSGTCLAVLEARLGEAASRQVDLSIRVATAVEARALLDAGPSDQALPTWARHPLRLQAEDHPSLRGLESLWLELDLPPGPRAVSAAAFLSPLLIARLRRPSPLSGGHPGAEQARTALGEILPTLHGRPLAPPQARRVARCLERIPPPAYLLYAFSLRGRGSEAVRLEIFGLGVTAMARYLKDIGAPVMGGRCAALAPLFRDAERHHLSFEIDPAGQVQPRLGIEYAMARRPRHEPRWAELFARLVKAGLCTPEQAGGALNFPGQDTFWSTGRRWPVEAAGVRGACVRALSHLKLVIDARGVQAKVYLIVRWRESANRK